MSIASNFPAISPTLNLSFALTKQLDPRITFTRASTATYYGTETAKAEENLLLYSQDLTLTAVWGNVNSTDAADVIAAPDGTLTADSITDNATSAAHFITRNSVIAVNTTYTYSCFLKAGTSNFATLVVNEAAVGERYFMAEFDLSTGAVNRTQAGSSGTLTSSSIVSVGNGWYRCVITGQTSAAATRVVVGVSDGTSAINSFGQVAYVGTGSDIYAWGAQLEQRSAVTAYTPTTTQAITNYIPVLETAASGVARFDHNPTTFESLGLEIEESRTNLYTNSFINQTGGTGMTYSNGFPALDPAQYFVLGQETTANSEHFFPDRSFVPILNTTYAFSVYAKQGSGNRRLALRVAAGNVGQINFNLTNGTAVSTTSGVISNATITPVGNGVYRCTVIWTATSATNTVTRFQLINGVSTVYTGDGYSGIFIWGAQLEAGAFATSYIPTVASQVTRAADDASMTGTNFSSWYNAGEGTMYAEASVYDVSSARNAFVINDGTTSNRILTGHGANPKGFIAAGGTTQMSQNITTVTFSANTFSKVSLAYADNNGNVAANGTIGTLDTAMTIPVVTQLQLGTQVGSLIQTLNGTIKKLAYYPIRVTDTQLQALTS